MKTIIAVSLVHLGNILILLVALGSSVTAADRSSTTKRKCQSSFTNGSEARAEENLAQMLANQLFGLPQPPSLYPLAAISRRLGNQLGLGLPKELFNPEKNPTATDASKSNGWNAGDPVTFRRVEKSDILTNCLGVFQGLYEVVQQQPELKAEMQKIGSRLASQPPEGQGNKGESRRPVPPQPAGKENHPVNFPPTGPVSHLPPPPPRPYEPHFRASAHSAFFPVCSDVATPTLKATAHTLCDSGYHTGPTVTTPVTGSSTSSCPSSMTLSPGMSIPPLCQIWPPQTSGLPFSPTTSAFVDAEFTSTSVRPAVGGRSYSPRPA
ncbi:hypothetical protein SprV_0200548200 [Sparganum proliferum]